MGLETRKSEIHELLATYYDDDCQIPKCSPGARLPILDMARTVIRNAGRHLSTQRVVELFRNTYGLTPPDNTVPMLERNGRQDKIFFLTGDGMIGLIEMRPKIKTVDTKQSPIRPRSVSAA